MLPYWMINAASCWYLVAVSNFTFLIAAAISLQGIIREEAPCYDLHKIDVDVTNPFANEGEFRVVCVETMDDSEVTHQNK